MFEEIVAILFSAVPGIEAMISSAYLVCLGAEHLIPLTIITNFIFVVAFLKIADNYKVPVKMERFIEKRVDRRVKRFEKWFSIHGNIIILLLIAIPFTGIGSYTGAFMGRVFGLRGTKFYLIIFLGIALSIIFSYPISYGINIIGYQC